LKTKILLIIFYSILTIAVFRSVFLGQTISGGDYVVFWPENIAYLRHFAFFAWDATVNFGLNSVGSLHSAPYSLYMGWIGLLVGDQTVWWERIVWWLPFFIFSSLSISILVKKLFPQNIVWYVAPFIFLFNTYVFMMIGGGQIGGIGLAYAIAPAVLYGFIRTINSTGSNNLKFSLLAGLLFAMQIVFDLRIAYVTLAAVVLYLVVSIMYQVSKKNIPTTLYLLLYTIVIPLGITGLLHAFWIIPMVLFRVNTIEQLGAAFNSFEAVKFFSFATIENSLSLLHPNWPENLFGKTYFMRAEFLLLPILAFSSLLFIDKKSSKYILFFSLLGLIGAFLAKGANEPFGQVYLWMFDHIPGFVMFRDPTKWYILTAISYAVLIPFSIASIYKLLSAKFKNKKFIPPLFLIFIFFFLLFLIRPVFSGELGGTFKSVTMPEEYRELKIFLLEENDVFRTMWIPKRQRFVFHSSAVPAIDAENLFQVSSASAVVNALKKAEAGRLVQEAGIRYVILPYDQQKELFVKNEKYDQKLYEQFVKELDKTSWLKRSQQFGKIIVYEVISPKDRFWLEHGKLTYQTISPTDYIISIENGKKGERLVFSDSYDSHWMAQVSGNSEKVQNVVYNKRYNSFILPKDGNYELNIFFAPQQWVHTGGLISLLTLVGVSIFIFKKR
jgi:hypothetical protein